VAKLSDRFYSIGNTIERMYKIQLLLNGSPCFQYNFTITNIFILHTEI